MPPPGKNPSTIQECALVGCAQCFDVAHAADGDPDGWLVVRLRMEWPHEVPARLLAMGERAEVLQPADLRSQVGELARRVAERYSVPPTAPVHPTTTHSRG